MRACDPVVRAGAVGAPGSRALLRADWGNLSLCACALSLGFRQRACPYRSLVGVPVKTVDRLPAPPPSQPAPASFTQSPA